MHLELFPEVPASWRDDKLAEKWRKVRLVRRAVTGALEIERAGKRIGSSLEADPIVHVSNPELFEAMLGVDLAEICITSAATLVQGEGPADAFRLPDVPGVAVVTKLAEGRKCARSWKISPAVGSDPQYPDVTPRDAQALREWDTMQGDGVSDRANYLWGPLTKLGLATAAIVCALDQALKLWLIFVFDLGAKGVVALTPFVALVLTWNNGISYGWFQQEGPFGQGALLALKVVAVALLWIWLARAGDRLTALSLGLIIGGAVGNGIDRLAYGAVADFVLLHIETATWSFNWYVFNLADVAIVAGVAGLLYESLLGDRAAKAP